MKNSKKITIVALLLILSSCAKNLTDYINQHKFDILLARVNTDSVEADGVSTLAITAKISNNADLKKVSFYTTHGKIFDSNSSYTVTAAQQGDSLIASAYLISTIDTNSQVLLTVAVPGVDTVIHLRFVTAYPDAIHLETTAETLQNSLGSIIALKTHLVRNIGTPSINQKVVFTAYKDDNSHVGRFTSIDYNGSDQNGIVNATFVLNDTSKMLNKNYSNKIRIVGTCMGKGQSIADTLNIFLLHN